MSSYTPCSTQMVIFDRNFDLSKGINAQVNAVAGVSRFLSGYRRKRKKPVSRSEIHRWFRGTPGWMIDFALLKMTNMGTVMRLPDGKYQVSPGYVVEHRYPDGTMLDRIHVDDPDLAEIEMKDAEKLAEPGETIAIVSVLGFRRSIVSEIVV